MSRSSVCFSRSSEMAPVVNAGAMKATSDLEEIFLKVTGQDEEEGAA